MANVKKGNLTASKELSKHLRPFWRRIFWKGERKAQAQAMQDRIDDDYPLHEFYADTCTIDHPCPLCLHNSATPK